MPKARPQAPDAKVKVNYVDPRLLTEQEYDKDFPEWKHVWKSNDAELKEFEWVKDAKGARVTNGLQSLARISKDAWMTRKKQQSDDTLDLMKTIRKNTDGTAAWTDPLVKHRNPKKVGIEE